MRYLCLLACLAFALSAQAQKGKPGAEKKDSSAPKVEIKDGQRVKIRQQKTKITATMDSVYNERVKLAYIDSIYIPRDLYDCFRELDKLMEPGVKKTFMEFSDEEVDRRTHASLGKWIDHKWSLTEGSRLSAYFTKMKVPHPDYMIGIIITSFPFYR